MQKISGAEYPLKKIFSDDFDFIIPSYQRPYAWTIEEAGELFDDLYSFMNQDGSGEKDDPYFLGSIVLIKREGEPLSEVIDGQQRLTTLTILMAAVANKVQGEEKKALLKYINEPGNLAEELDPKPRLALRDRDRDFFKKYIQTEGKLIDLINIDPVILTDPQQNVRNNTELFLKNLSEMDDQKAFELGKFIVNRCYLVAVSTPTMRSAYRIFSVLNDRGLELMPSDILKAEIIGKIPSSMRDEYTKKWEDEEEELGRDAFSDLFSHVRMIYRKAKQQKTILDEFREYVLSQEIDPRRFIDEILCPYGDAYQTILSSSYESTQNAQLINNALEWLLRIDNVDWIAPSILFLKKHNDKSDLLAKFFKDIERLTASMFIRRCMINERIDRFGKLIQAIENDDNLWDENSPLQLTEKDKIETVAALESDIYQSRKTRSYILQRLDSWLADRAASYHHKIITVEHVLPQTVEPGSEWEKTWPDESIRDQWIHKLGNLLLLSRRKNSSAQNYDFAKKKQKYFASKSGVSTFAITTSVLEKSEWTPESVEKRQKEMLNLLKNGWRLSLS